MKKLLLFVVMVLSFVGVSRADGLIDQIKLSLLDHVGPVTQFANSETRVAYADSIVLVGQHNGSSIFDIQGAFTSNVKPKPDEVTGANLAFGGFLKLSAFTKDKVKLSDWWKFLNSIEYGPKYDYDTRTHHGYGSFQVGLFKEF